MLNHPYKTWVEISRQALTHNVGQFHKLLKKGTRLMAIVKSNAYGHGARELVPILHRAGIVWYGVDSIDEAKDINAIRDEYYTLILGYTLQNRLEEAVKNNFRLTVYNPETINTLGEITKRLNKPAYLHIKCETGTSRQGVTLKDLIPLAKLIGKHKHLILEGLSTHYANIEDTTDHSYAKTQLLNFKRMIRALENIGIRVPIKHASCSAAAMLFPETHFNIARVGIGLYGLWPSPETVISAKEQNKKIDLKPVLTWKTCVAQVKSIPKGTPVSYGLTEEVGRNSKLAVLPIGYRDGFDRGLSSVGTVLIHGQRARVVGRVCMNMCNVDVTDIRGVKTEDEVVLIGQQGSRTISTNDLAQKIDTINYEIVTRLNPLIPRIHV